MGRGPAQLNGSLDSASPHAPAPGCLTILCTAEHSSFLHAVDPSPRVLGLRHQVRGYEHVGPYDAEIGAPKPAIRRTGSAASAASGGSAAYGHPAALSRSPGPGLRGRRSSSHRRDGSSGSLASMESLGSVGSLASLAGAISRGQTLTPWLLLLLLLLLLTCAALVCLCIESTASLWSLCRATPAGCCRQ